MPLRMTCDEEDVEFHEDVSIIEREELSDVQQQKYLNETERYNNYIKSIDEYKRKGYNVIEIKDATPKTSLLKHNLKPFSVNLNSNPKFVDISQLKNSPPCINIQKPTNAAESSNERPPATTKSIVLPNNSVVLKPNGLGSNTPIRTIILPNSRQLASLGNQTLYIRIPGSLSQSSSTINLQNFTSHAISASSAAMNGLPTLQPPIVKSFRGRPPVYNNINNHVFGSMNSIRGQLPVSTSTTQSVNLPISATSNNMLQQPISNVTTTMHSKNIIEQAPAMTELRIYVDEYYYSSVNLRRNLSFHGSLMPKEIKCHFSCFLEFDNISITKHLLDHIAELPLVRLRRVEKAHTECKFCMKTLPDSEISKHLLLHESKAVKSGCRICCKTMSSSTLFFEHMKKTHFAGEMPFKCPLCEFRSSMVFDISQHFSQRHKKWPYMMCPFCLRAINTLCKKPSQAMYDHLRQHVETGAVNSCPKCCLSFLTPAEIAQHHRVGHSPSALLELNKDLSIDVVPYCVKPEEKDDCLQVNEKDLLSNLPLTIDEPDETPMELDPPVLTREDQSEPESESDYDDFVVKAVNFSQLGVSSMASKNDNLVTTEGIEVTCSECKQKVSHEHYQLEEKCSLCEYQTNCMTSLNNHLKGAHRRSLLSPVKRKAEDVPMKCVDCDYITDNGNAMAKHLHVMQHSVCLLSNLNVDTVTKKIRTLSEND